MFVRALPLKIVVIGHSNNNNNVKVAQVKKLQENRFVSF